MPDLLTLPEELLCKISGFVHPQTVIEWACTCKVLSRCSLQALKTHKQRRSELRVVHDRNPITVPSLLRDSLSEPEILWYVRSLDIWDLRENFEEWMSPDFVEENPHVELDDWNSKESLTWPGEYHDPSHLDTTFYTDEELERYRTMLSKMLHLREPLVDKWMERLRSGSDEPQKVLLMAMSPRLSQATFVNEDDSWQAGEKSHPFRLLASSLRALAPLPCPEWPCFQNLKIVFVGQYTTLRHSFDAYHPHSRVIAPLFLLPAIEELHLNLLLGEENDAESDLENDEEDGKDSVPYVWEWEIGRSSCQKLAFNCCELATETIASFIGATHSLRSLSGVISDDEIISALLEHSKHSLETVNFDQQNLLPTPDAVPQQSLQTFQKLASIALSTTQLVDISTYKPSQIEYTVDHGIDMEKSAFGTTDWVDLLTFLPPTLQTLKIYQKRTRLFGHEIESLMDHLVALVKAKRSPSNGAFGALTEICLANLLVKSANPRRVYEPNGLDPWLGALKRVCEEAEVKIHTKARTTWIEGSSGDSYPCSSCRLDEMGQS